MHLWSACEAADVDEVRRYLNEGAKLTEKNRFGWTALHRACMGGSAECVELVLPEEAKARAAMIAKPDTEGNAPLHIAAGCAHADVVALLLREGAEAAMPKGTAEGLKEDGATPMHTACKALAATEDSKRQERLFDAVHYLRPLESAVGSIYLDKCRADTIPSIPSSVLLSLSPLSHLGATDRSAAPRWCSARGHRYERPHGCCFRAEATAYEVAGADSARSQPRLAPTPAGPSRRTGAAAAASQLIFPGMRGRTCVVAVAPSRHQTDRRESAHAQSAFCLLIVAHFSNFWPRTPARSLGSHLTHDQESNKD